MPAHPSRTDVSARTTARVRRAILAWYAAERRDFPWRRTHDPWAVLVSEVMLQQTQASRVVERFPGFLARFPTPAALAAADDAAVLAAWSGLGYYRRALALRRAAQALVASGWPSDVADLRRLPGVGPYTARAVAALALGRPLGVVDTNVRRWLIRRFGLSPDVAAGPLQALADALAAPALDADAAATWAHASMEFGARICASRVPACARCPVARGCPSRLRPARVPVARQAAYPGSSRAARGALLRALVTAPGHALPLSTAVAIAGAAATAGPEGVLAALERDGLVHRDADLLRLGGSGASPGAATIGP